MSPDAVVSTTDSLMLMVKLAIKSADIRIEHQRASVFVKVVCPKIVTPQLGFEWHDLDHRDRDAGP